MPLALKALLDRDEITPAFPQGVSSRGGTASLSANAAVTMATVTLPAAAPAGTYLVSGAVFVNMSAAGNLTARCRNGSASMGDYVSQVPAGYATIPVLYSVTKTAGAAVTINLEATCSASATSPGGSTLAVSPLNITPPPLNRRRAAVRRLGNWLGDQ